MSEGVKRMSYRPADYAVEPGRRGSCWEAAFTPALLDALASRRGPESQGYGTSRPHHSGERPA